MFNLKRLDDTLLNLAIKYPSLHRDRCASNCLFVLF